MGFSTSIYLGAFIKFEPYKADLTKTQHICPKCKVERTTQFCAECGTKIVDTSKKNSVTLTRPWQIIDHIGILEGKDFDHLHDTFTGYEFPENLLFPNYVSEYISYMDTNDDAFFDSKMLYDNKDEAVGELINEAEELIPLFDKHKVGYNILHGVTWFSS